MNLKFTCEIHFVIFASPLIGFVLESVHYSDIFIFNCTDKIIKNFVQIAIGVAAHYGLISI